MLFQTFDEKKDCFMVYKGHEFHRHVTPDCTKTWSYANYLKQENVDYANLFVNGRSLEESCPGQWINELNEAQSKIKAVLKSATVAGLNLKDTCVYDLVPEHMLKTWASIKNDICDHIFDNNPRPAHYDLLLKVEKMITEIKFQPLNADHEEVIITNVQDKNTYKALEECNKFISYDQFKTKTGRLSTKKNSFPVMTLAKKYRNVLKPTNDWLFEIDFNAYELRVALGLLGQQQPEEDLHDWNLQHVFVRSKDRENAKKRIFAWLYNPKSSEDRIGQIYDREKIKSLHFKDNKVKTIFNREIECDEDHAVSYIVQSTAADLLFEQMYKIWELLEDRKSFIKFCNHDSLVIDFSEEDQYILNEIKHTFNNTRLGKFKVSCSAGKNWLDMKRLNIN
jgi:hypothetical protein